MSKHVFVFLYLGALTGSMVMTVLGAQSFLFWLRNGHALFGPEASIVAALGGAALLTVLFRGLREDSIEEGGSK